MIETLRLSSDVLGFLSYNIFLYAQPLYLAASAVRLIPTIYAANLISIFYFVTIHKSYQMLLLTSHVVCH